MKKIKFKTFKGQAKQNPYTSSEVYLVYLYELCSNKRILYTCRMHCLLERSTAEQTRAWVFLNSIPSQTPSVPCREQFLICLKHRNEVSLPILYIIFPVCLGYEWLLNIFLSLICLGNMAVGEGRQILLSLEENYFNYFNQDSNA